MTSIIFKEISQNSYQAWQNLVNRRRVLKGTATLSGEGRKVQWLIPVILALWESQVGRSLDSRSSRAVWATQKDPASLKKKKHLWYFLLSIFLMSENFLLPTFSILMSLVGAKWILPDLLLPTCQQASGIQTQIRPIRALLGKFWNQNHDSAPAIRRNCSFMRL